MVKSVVFSTPEQALRVGTNDDADALRQTLPGIDVVERKTKDGTGSGDYDVLVRSAWFELPLGDSGWRVSYRLLPRAGQVVIGEIRIFPDETDFPGRQAGEWSAKWLGNGARCPAGGITSRLLRQVRTRAQLGRAFTQLLAWHADHTPRFESHLREIGFGDVPARPRHRGRRGRPDLFYAQLAAAYVHRLRAQSFTPIADLAADRKLAQRLGLLPHECTAARIRDAIHTARTRGLLDGPDMRGYAGGRLTSRAEALLRASDRADATPHHSSARRKARR